MIKAMKEEKIEIISGTSPGITAPIYIQEIARKNIAAYNTQYVSQLMGHSQDGTPIAVNTIGRFVFGVPGVAPHVRIVSEGNTILIFFPKDTDPMVVDFLNQIKEFIEIKA